MASFVFLTDKPALGEIAGHPVYRDFLSLLLYVCSASNSSQNTKHLRKAYDRGATMQQVNKYIRSDLHALVQAGLLARKQLLLPPPTIGSQPLSVLHRQNLKPQKSDNPLEQLRDPSADEIIAAATGRTPPFAAFKTLNVYHVTKNTKDIFTKYGDPNRRLKVEFGELFAFGVTEFFLAEDLRSELACGPSEISDCVKNYEERSRQTADLLDLTSHELVTRLTYAELVFRLRDRGTDEFKDLVRNAQFHFAHPRTTKAELKSVFVRFLESKQKERLEVW